MKVLSRTMDSRINSTNIYAEITFKEYLSYATNVISNNDLQRKRVRSSKTVYSLLKMDLMKGCVIPPIVLAIRSDDEGVDYLEGDDLQNYIVQNKDKVIILDGLQRTYTLIDAEKDILNSGSGDNIEKFYNHTLRLEIYVNINRFGVLYRMLTLNTGQTPMSIRHQLEMLYRDMLGIEVEGVTLVTDNSGKAKPEDFQFAFKNLIDGFNAYVSRNAQPMDRQDLLESIKVLENMSSENLQVDLFKEFVEVYADFFNRIYDLAGDFYVDDSVIEEFEITGSPYGKSVAGIFATSQAMTGFGSAVGVMKDRNLVAGLTDICELIGSIEEGEQDHEWVKIFLSYMDIIRNTSKKIGNAQRLYFHFIFRELFNKEGDSYANLSDAVENGYNRYYSQV